MSSDYPLFSLTRNRGDLWNLPGPTVPFPRTTILLTRSSETSAWNTPTSSLYHGYVHGEETLRLTTPPPHL
ncbi:hypothetical protein K402DRAFT_86004 [Aulographum hederae CBS 113979]|uniref:Uncharacterized protein n=1 Tax=Aulographum hederae CBS 113979 TaxID=1176131 RepID=A0A6G1GZA2_9PEZI|nr:hypothetical protein K402DRAFT_86004 [Aulographum hederae CBS 113979]